MVEGDSFDLSVEVCYLEVIKKINGIVLKVECVECFVFYECVKKIYVVVIIGEIVKYGNVIIKKGVMFVE